MFSNRIVGYSVSDQMQARLAVDALNMAVAGAVTWPAASSIPTGFAVPVPQVPRRDPAPRVAGVMGRVRSAGDNAAMESFFALLQKNVLNRRRWATRQDLRLAIITWIERTYHRRRRQTRLARLTPIEYDTIMTTTALQAA